MCGNAVLLAEAGQEPEKALELLQVWPFHN